MNRILKNKNWPHISLLIFSNFKYTTYYNIQDFFNKWILYIYYLSIFLLDLLVMCYDGLCNLLCLLTNTNTQPKKKIRIFDIYCVSDCLCHASLSSYIKNYKIVTDSYVLGL